MSGIDEAREVLPWRVVWGPLLFTVPGFILLSLLGIGAAAMVTLWPLRWASEGDWVDRARLGFPAARVIGMAVVVMPLLWVLEASLLLGPLCPVPRPILLALIGAGTFAAALVVARWVSQRLLQRPLPISRWVRGVILL